jgi:catechol 2,3-dioxygenase-like lactoylglutathione lyase family enzyme
LRIERIHHVQITIPSGQEDQGRAFYCGVLGLPEIPKPDSLKGRGGFWLQAGDVQLHVGTEDGVDRTRTKAHVAFQVTDLSEALEALRKVGIEPLDSVPIPGMDRFEFRDPFGNRVEFLQRY